MHYAFHFDSAQYASFLRSVAENPWRGTHRGKIEQVNLDEKKERILSLSSQMARP